MLLISCVICKQVINVGEEEVCSTNICGHVGHTRCFNKWRALSTSCPKCRTETISLVKLYFETTEMDSVIDELKEEIVMQKNKRHKLMVLMNRSNENKVLLNEPITLNPTDFPNRLTVLLDRNLENRRIQRHIVNINPRHFDERQLMIALNREEENLRIREHLGDIRGFE